MAESVNPSDQMGHPDATHNHVPHRCIMTVTHLQVRAEITRPTKGWGKTRPGDVRQITWGPAPRSEDSDFPGAAGSRILPPILIFFRPCT